MGITINHREHKKFKDETWLEEDLPNSIHSPNSFYNLFEARHCIFMAIRYCIQEPW